MSNNKQKNRMTIYLVIGILLICAAIVLILLFLMHGQTTVSENNEGNKTIKHIVCESHTTPYSLFEYDESDNKSLKINATFENDSFMQ